MEKMPLLTRPNLRDVLILYMAIVPEAGSSVLMREEGGDQQPIYYVSNTFKNAKLRYLSIEKMGYTLLLAARRLRPYYQLHIIKVMANFSLEKHLKKYEKSTQMLN